MAVISTDMFPTKFSFLIFIVYMALFINQGMIVTASQSKGNHYNYNTTMVVLFSEFLKLFVAFFIYMKDHTFYKFSTEFFKDRKVLCLYMIPAALYCLYNNLQFTNLASYDPTTYFLLLQMRVVVTSILFQVVFMKKLSHIQWASVFLLTVGCIIKEVNHKSKTLSSSYSRADNLAHTGSSVMPYLDLSLFLILLQVFCSCFAGVYNEYLLKDKGCDVHIMMANMYMYIQSVLCNVVALLFSGDRFIFSMSAIGTLAQPSVIAIVVNNAAIGIVTSLFLSSMNSILKTFASALELVFTAFLSWILFSIHVDALTVLSLAIVITATLLYARNPVVNKARNNAPEQKEMVAKV